jgi:hypothetical protein
MNWLPRSEIAKTGAVPFLDILCQVQQGAQNATIRFYTDDIIRTCNHFSQAISQLADPFCHLIHNLCRLQFPMGD